MSESDDKKIEYLFLLEELFEREKLKNIYNQELVVTLEAPKNGNRGVLLSNEYGLSTKNKDLKAGDIIKISEFTEGADWLKRYGCKYFITKYDKVKNTDF